MRHEDKGPEGMLRQTGRHLRHAMLWQLWRSSHTLALPHAGWADTIGDQPDRPLPPVRGDRVEPAQRHCAKGKAMASWTRIGAAALGGALAGTVATLVAGTVLWNRASARAVARLDALALTGRNVPRPTFSREQLAGLPGPVARYFEFALTPG